MLINLVSVWSVLVINRWDVRDGEDFSSTLLQKSVLMLPQAGVQLPFKEQFRYLGTYFSRFLHFNNHQQQSVSYIVIYCLFRPWNISKFDISIGFAHKSLSQILSPPNTKLRYTQPSLRWLVYCGISCSWCRAKRNTWGGDATSIKVGDASCSCGVKWKFDAPPQLPAASAFQCALAVVSMRLDR